MFSRPTWMWHDREPSAPATIPPPFQQISMVLISLSSWFNPRAIAWPEGLKSIKNASDLIGNRTAT